MKMLRSQKGELTLGGILFLALLVAGGYVGYKLIVPQVRYNQVKEIFRNAVARLKVADEELVRKEVFDKLKEVNVTLDEDEDFEDGLRIVREEGQPVVMEAKFTIHVDFITGHRKTLVFYPRKVAKQM